MECAGRAQRRRRFGLRLRGDICLSRGFGYKEIKPKRGRRFALHPHSIVAGFWRLGLFLEAMERTTPWPHAPEHRLSVRGTYFVTVGTYLKQHHFRGAERLCVLHRGLLTVCQDDKWRLEAWAVFSNHYHFIAHSPEDQADASSSIRSSERRPTRTGAGSQPVSVVQCQVVRAERNTCAG